MKIIFPLDDFIVVSTLSEDVTHLHFVFIPVSHFQGRRRIQGMFPVFALKAGYVFYLL